MNHKNTVGPGRPRSGQQEARRIQVLEAALQELVEKGYDKVTMLGVAKRASASKETLYTWFGDKRGLFTELITRNADVTAVRIKEALSESSEPEKTLIQFASGLLRLLCSDESVALNRAAVSAPELAEILLSQGRYRVGPLVEAYLKKLQSVGIIKKRSTSEQFTLLYGLVVRDSQIRVLLGEKTPVGNRLQAQAKTGVEQFLKLENLGSNQA